MKKTLQLLFLLSIVSNRLSAQVPNCNAPTSYSEQARHILKNLDKSQIPTGILYQEVFPWADIDQFDATSQTDTSTNYHFFQSYSEIFYSSYNSSNLVHPADLENSISNFHSNKDFHHAMGIIDYNFNSLSPDAIANNQLYVVNNQLYDVQGRSSSPYLSKRTFMSGLLQANSIENFYDGTHYLYFEPSFTFTNRNAQISNYQYIDFYIDGVFMQRNYTNGSNYLTVPLYFPQFEGESTFSIIYHKTTGEDEVSRIRLKRKINKNFTSCNGGNQVFITGDSFDGGYGTGAYGAQGRGYIFFADNNCASQQLKKVVIFVDGFDPNNGRNAWTIWESRVNAEIRDNNQQIVKFGNELRTNGYDVVIYDYDEDATNRGGGGYVENNGIAFARFLEKLYTLHQSTLQQDFIIIAPSMAALVVRYGLTWAEKNNVAHHGALYVSFDGPHQGAHVTSGVQQSIDMFTQYGGLKQYENIKNAVHQTNAGKQMLINHSSQESETFQAHPYRQQFLTNLATVGNYPQNIRKIAISDGNRNGILKSQAINGFEPCDEMLAVKIKQRLRPFCNSCNKLTVETFAQTNSTRCKSMEMTVKNNANVLKALIGATTEDKFTFYSEPVYTNKSYDKAQGGMFVLEADIELYWWQKGIAWALSGSLKIEKNLMPKSNFVPTISSADYSFPNNEAYNIYKNFSGITLSKCAGTTPFDTVYALSQDFNHARIDGDLLEIFRNEIYNLKTKSVCSGLCPDYLTLNSPLPSNSKQTYKAAKAINLEPNFIAQNGTVIKAEIGCDNLSIAKVNNNQNQNINSILPVCEFDWDLAQTEIYCNPGTGTNTFKIFVNRYFDISSYPEFSIDGSTWYKPNNGDKGAQWILLSNPGQPQIFYARPKNDPNKTISMTLNYCN
jgi:hypothetical protein